MSESNSSHEAYCPNCEETKEIVVTVAWQDDICTECRNSVNR